jgi:hypothetical protein
MRLRFVLIVANKLSDIPSLKKRSHDSTRLRTTGGLGGQSERGSHRKGVLASNDLVRC